jgi:hypothetical protein
VSDTPAAAPPAPQSPKASDTERLQRRGIEGAAPPKTGAPVTDKMVKK